MKNLLLYIFSAVIFSYTGYAQVKNDECLNCHSYAGDNLQKPADLYINDIHYKYGISCASCHGGDASSDDLEISMSKEKGFIGIPKRTDRHLLCVKCHDDAEKMKGFGTKISTNQFSNLKSSVHFKTTFNNQGPVADCITCHGIHDIAKTNSPQSKVYPSNIISLCGGCHSNAEYMKNYNPSLPVDQAAKYKTSIHGIKNSAGDINAATCSSCHGSHDIKPAGDPRSKVYASNIPQVCSSCHSNKNLMAKYGIPTDQYSSFTVSVHGKALLEKGDLSAPSCNDCHGNHGAAPPGIESISKVCGTCHVLNLELFEKSRHKTAFEKKNLPECESCHGNHNISIASDENTGTGSKSFCITCHKEGDKGFKTASDMKQLIDSLKQEEMISKKILFEAVQKGMDVSDAEYELKEIKSILIKSRTELHGFDIDSFEEVIKPGFNITNNAKKTGEESISDYFFRRKGLAVSTIIVTVLVIGLFLKLKRIEKQQNS